VGIDIGAAALLSLFVPATLPRGQTIGVVLTAAACALVTTSSVGWRRRAPIAAVVVSCAGMVGYAWLVQTQSSLGVWAFAVSLTTYTAGSRGVSPRRIDGLAALVAYGILMCALAVWGVGDLTVASVAVFSLSLTIGPPVAGFLVARQRAMGMELAATTRRLRAEEETRLAVARASERNRVARDLHDVVAHGVSLMVVQAGAARITVTDEPELARAALGEVVIAGRAALVELRRILGVMSVEGTEVNESPGPGFGVDGIVDLVERRRAAGLPITINVTGDRRTLPAEIDVAVYRLVQEALTNVVKHAHSAPTEVAIALEEATVRVSVRNSVLTEPTDPVGGSGHGLVGMRERVTSCGGRLWCGPQPDGGFAVRAELPLISPGQEAMDPRAGWAVRLHKRLLRLGQWPEVIAAMVVLCPIVFISSDRSGPLALNVGLVAAMLIALLWRRRYPFLFLVAINLLALPISDGIASVNDLTLVSLFVFVVPIWTVAVWCETPAAIGGLVVTSACYLGEGMYWHFSSTPAALIVTVGLWAVGRFVRSERLMSVDLERKLALVEAEQQARESLIVSTERARLVTALHAQVADEVTVMVVAADSLGDLISDAPAAAASIRDIEQSGRRALGRLREILGLLRSEHDPAPLSPQLGMDQFRNLVSRYNRRGTGSSLILSVNGRPTPLPKGLDLVAYQIVEDVLSSSAGMAGCSGLDVRFEQHSIRLSFSLNGRTGGWMGPTLPDEIVRAGGHVAKAVTETGEVVSVELPLEVTARRP
jgi:signal transduction histidine kinase